MLLVLTALAAFLLLRAAGYLGEAVLIRQVAEMWDKKKGYDPGDRREAGGGGSPSGLKGEPGEDVARSPGLEEAAEEIMRSLSAAFRVSTARKCPGDGSEGARTSAPADGREVCPRKEKAPSLPEAFRASAGHYGRIWLTLLPWDTARVAAMSLATILVFLWGKWDPHLRFVVLYLAAFLLWFFLLLAVYVLLGIPVLLAARQVVINGTRPIGAWREGWSLFRKETLHCLVTWLQALAADAAFLVLAWPLSLLLTWAAEGAAEALNPSALEWLARAPLYLVLAAALLLGQVVTQAYKSSLWTIFFLSRS